MLSSAFTFNLKQQIQEGLVAIAKIDGVNPTLVCGTVGGKIFTHSPHQKEASEDINFLSFNKKIQSLCTGSFTGFKDNIFFASDNVIIAYDIEKNQELFYQEISEGISQINFGIIGKNLPELYVGGNCSLQGLNKNGEDVYWNVTSDNVSAITFFDIDDDKLQELIIGTEDNNITVFKDEEILFQIEEKGIPICLEPLYAQNFAYGLNNGMIGVYYKKKRRWKIKKKFKPISLIGIIPEEENASGDIFTALIVGWQNGKIEVRSDISGEILFKLDLKESLVKLLKFDFRQSQQDQIICVTSEGYIRGFNLNKIKTQSQAQSSESSQNSKDLQSQNDILKELQKKTSELQNELNSLKGLSSTSKGFVSNAAQQVSLIPAGTIVEGSFTHNQKKKVAEILITVNNDVIIRGVIIFSDKALKSKRLLHFPDNPTSQTRIPLPISENSQEALEIYVLLGNLQMGQDYYVHSMKVLMPKFINFMHVEQLSSEQIPESKVEFTVKEWIPRFTKWLQQCFILSSSFIEQLEQKEKIVLCFANLQELFPLQISISPKEENGIVIYTENMKLAGDIIQDLCDYMNIQDLKSVCNFKEEMKNLSTLLTTIQEQQSLRTHISGDIAEGIGNIKVFTVKSEDSRIQGNMGEMKKNLTNIMNENRKLIAELKQRNNNHQTLLDSLKLLNQMITKAGNLRNGKYKQQVINLCRQSIKNNSIFALVKITQTGEE